MSAKGLFIVLVTFTGKKMCMALQDGSFGRGKSYGKFRLSSGLHGSNSHDPPDS